MRDALAIHLNHLPHWRMAGSIYFVTWRLKEGVVDLSENERTIVLNALRFFHLQRYRLFGYCVINDHVHLLLEPYSDFTHESILHSLKSFTAHQINKLRGTKGHIWQKASYDRIMRDEAEVLEKLQYMLNNPQERWPDCHDYQWAGRIAWD